MNETIKPGEAPIVFYDGVCGVCNWFVQWVIKRDPAGIFRFAPIQGETAGQMLGPIDENPQAWSIWLIDESGRTEASTAVLRIVRRLKWGFGLPALALAFPRALRDAVYRAFAKNRYRVFGKVDACAIPTPAVRARLLP
jgi:predicted DCC family thiol-disulfide oxidoreductase YuxK